LFRETKDLDIFCKPSEFPVILKVFSDKGYATEVTDARWLGKIFKGDCFIDVICNSVNSIWTVNDNWFERSLKGKLFGAEVRFTSAEDIFRCKIYIQNRERYDGADLNHLILRYGHKLNWKWILEHLDMHWQLLLGQIINFQFVYPSERQLIPEWLMEELLKRLSALNAMPTSQEKVCQGPLIDQTQYETDIKQWDFKAFTIKTI
jgi:hypothetical protein